MFIHWTEKRAKTLKEKKIRMENYTASVREGGGERERENERGKGKEKERKKENACNFLKNTADAVFHL